MYTPIKWYLERGFTPEQILLCELAALAIGAGSVWLVSQLF